MLAFTKRHILQIMALYASMAVACPVGLAAEQDWQPLRPGMKLKPGDRVLVEDFGTWVEGTVVGFFGGQADLPEVRFRSSVMGREMTRPFRLEEIRVPVRPKKGAVPRAPADSENPFETGGRFREWTDSSGTFKIEAEAVEIGETEVTLKKRDGSQIAVPINRLSDADRKYLDSLKNKEPEFENPYGEESGGVEPDWSRTRGIMFSNRAKPSNLEPDGGLTPGMISDRPLVLPQGGQFDERTFGVYPAAEDPNLVAISVAAGRGDGDDSGFFLCNLARGKYSAEAIGTPDRSVLLDLGADGTTFLSRGNGAGPGGATRLNLWKIEGKECVKQWSCDPYAGRVASHYADIRWGRILDADHVLTVSSGGNLTLWKVPEMQAVYSAVLDASSSVALSPGRRYLAVSVVGAVFLLDPKSGDVLGACEGAGQGGTLCFRPDGKRIALATSTRVQVWDFSTGQMYRDIGFSVPYLSHPTPVWPAPGYVLIGGRYLIDLEHHLLLWEYRPMGMTAASIGRRTWFLTDNGQQRLLVPFAVPQEEVIKAVKEIKPADTLVLQPNMEVTLDVEIPESPEKQKEITERYLKNLKDNGFRIGKNAPVRVLVRTEAGKTEEANYERFGVPFGADVMRGTFQEKISRVTIVIEGMPAWELSSRTVAPLSLGIRAGQSAGQALDKHRGPDLDFFDKVVLPRYLCVAKTTHTFGATEFTSSGARSAPPSERKKPEKP